MLSDQCFWRRKFLKVFLLSLPWQPEFFVEHNDLNEFKRGSPKEHSCEFGKNPVNSY